MTITQMRKYLEALEAEGYEVDTYFDSEQALIGLI